MFSFSLPPRAPHYAERQVTLKVETPGNVAEVLVLPGERVRAGQVLVCLDPVLPPEGKRPTFRCSTGRSLIVA